MNTHAQAVLDTISLRSALKIPGEALDQVMATAYVLYRLGRHAEVEVLCKGLIAADHQYWWSYSLYAAALREQGRFEDALVQLDLGLRHEPAQPKLVEMKRELLRRLGQRPSGAAATLHPVPEAPATARPTTSNHDATLTVRPHS